MKSLLFPELLRQTKISFVTKTDNNYMCLSCEKFTLGDITCYLTAGTSYTKLFKAFRVQTGEKGYFPYEYV